MIRRLHAFLFDDPTPALLDHAPVNPDPDLARRNAERIAAAKRTLGDRYICAKPINSLNVIEWTPPK